MKILTREDWNNIITNKEYDKILKQCEGMVKNITNTYVNRFIANEDEAPTKTYVIELFDIYQSAAYQAVFKSVDAYDTQSPTNATFLTYTKQSIINAIRAEYHLIKRYQNRYPKSDLEVLTYAPASIDSTFDPELFMLLIDSMLKPKQQMIIKQFFGIDCEPQTMTAIGKELNLTPQAISLQLTKSMRILKNNKEKLTQAL
jgi:RNA polymerase sigma factor (sigma-70 family)